jgi:hypothetical protein
MATDKTQPPTLPAPVGPTTIATKESWEDFVTSERPEGHDEGTLGNEGIGRGDILMPRIGLAQKMSPEIDATTPRYIEGLKFMDLYHSLSKKNYGQGPLRFVILRRDEPRWIEFNPIDEGGGIKDMDVRFGDPRTKFGEDGEKPVATEFHDYIVLLLNDFDPTKPLDSIAALSLKSSGLKAAKHLNFLITLRGPKLLCKGVYALTSGHDKDKKSGGVYATYKFENAGWLKKDSPLEKLAVEMFEAWKSRENVQIDRGDGTDFDPAEYDKTPPVVAKTEM